MPVAKAFLPVGHELSEMQVILDQDGMRLEDKQDRRRDTQKRNREEPAEDENEMSPMQYFEIRQTDYADESHADTGVQDANFLDYEETIASEIIGTMPPAKGAIDPEAPILMPQNVLELFEARETEASARQHALQNHRQ